MSWNQNGKNRKPAKPVSGCLGRMVNLFDLNTGVGGNRLLTDKPHRDSSALSRRQSDLSRANSINDDMDDLRNSPSNRKSNCTPIKMLIAQEMSKEEEDSKQSPSNLVAKLMGLDALPDQHKPVSALRGTHTRSRTQSGSLDFLQQENGKHEINQYPEEYKDVYEYVKRDESPQKGKCSEKQKMALVREKFMEAKRLSTDENLRQSKQFQDALEVLSSNKDVFLKFLQEPNSLFSQNLYTLQSGPPPPDCKRITILKPSKPIDNHNKTSPDLSFSSEFCKVDDVSNPNPPTRIVILKPSSMNIKAVASHDDVFVEDPEEVTNEISDNLGGLRRDETLLSSVFSNGYIGDDSSYCKSEVDYATGILSDSEIVSPTSKHSWDYINRYSSHYSASSSRASYSPESSVCREAKKRLSERWAVMSSNKNVLEQREIQRSSSTLGDMLALSDVKKPENVDETKRFKEDNDINPIGLLRSKSLPVSGSSTDKVDETKGVMKEKLVKSSSFKFSNLFFPRSKKTSKDGSHQCKEVPQSTRFIGNEEAQRSNEMIVEEASCSGLKHGILLPEVGFSFKKPGFRGNHIENQDHPSPISVLEPQFEDEHATKCRPNSKLNGIESMKYNLIDKSPPIGSIARTLSWDDSVGSSTPYVGRPSSTPLNQEEEEQECLFYIQTLLSVAGLNKVKSISFLSKWHSPESPLDPSLRDKCINLSDLSSMPKRRHQNTITKLVFDCVNEALKSIAKRGPYSGAHDSLDYMVMSSMVLVDLVWAHIKEWMSGDERCDWDDVDGGSMAVERVVNKEVVGQGWVEGIRFEIDNTRKEIEGKLLEELVQESVLEFTGRV
ncbi:uncharacterized protein [Rutidosis leptorrhynchoides]|uniref:uncharacterized protein n=1 Tax=Rutidosis leptorrhynchoides TaxID=125765 RepID=UPI003A99AB67